LLTRQRRLFADIRLRIAPSLRESECKEPGLSVHKERGPDRFERAAYHHRQSDPEIEIAELRVGICRPIGRERMHAERERLCRNDALRNDAHIRRADFQAVGTPADLGGQPDPGVVAGTEAYHDLRVQTADRVELMGDMSREFACGFERCGTAAQGEDGETGREHALLVRLVAELVLLGPLLDLGPPGPLQ